MARLSPLFLASVLGLASASAGLAPGAETPAPPEAVTLVPARQVQLKNQVVPHWKEIWDEARRLTRMADYTGAVQAYRLLLAEREELTAARWEMVKILLQLKRFEPAAESLERLLEGEPDRPEYLLGLALMVQERGQYSRSVELFKKIHEQQPQNREALAGVTDGLLALGQKENALPLLEKLLTLQPANDHRRRQLAELYVELGALAKARPLALALAADPAADGALLQLAARLLERLGDANRAEEYWLRLAAKSPAAAEPHEHLALFYEKQGQLRNALPHRLALAKLKPDELDLQLRLAQSYLTLGEPTSALAYLKRYLEKRPADQEALGFLAAIDSSLRHKPPAPLAAAASGLLPPAAPVVPDWAALERSARWADHEGDWQEAVPIYRQLLAEKPDDAGLLTALARDLDTLGQEEEALAVWSKLARVTPEAVGVYRTMADHLTRLGRGTELIAVLEEIHARQPEDLAVVLQLAGLTLDHGDLAACKKYFEILAEQGVRSAEFFAGRSRYYEASRQPLLALGDYLELLALQPGRHDLRGRVMELAGEFGRVEVVADQLRALDQGDHRTIADDWRLRLAEAWRACRADDQAGELYRALSKSGGQEVRLPAILGLADLYEEAGRPYEAGQELRLALGYGYQTPALFARLLRLALAAGRFAEAEAWLTGLERVLPTTAWQVRMAQIQLLAVQGKMRPAREQAETLASAWLGRREAGAEAQEAQEALLEFWVGHREWAQAAALAQELLRQESPSLAPQVVLQLIYDRSGEVEKEAEIGKALLARSREPRVALQCVRLYQRYRMAWPMIQFSRQFLEQVPDSLNGKILLAEGLAMAGELSEAVRQWQAIRRDYPDHTTAAVKLAELDFARGEFASALVAADSVLKRQPERPDLLLLKERVLWAQQDWSAAIQVGQGYLEPPVAESLAATLAAQGLPPLPREEPHRTWLEVATFSAGEQPDPVAAAMATDRFLESGPEGRRRWQQVVAGFWARYCWQTKFAAELAIRRSVQSREYFLAVKLYEGFLAKYPADDSLLFDLAGVYSRLDRLTEEAAVYTQLAKRNEEFPGLQEAVKRNRLKQRPQLAVTTWYSTEGGRDGYKDMEKTWQELRLSQFAQPGQSWEVAAANLDYRAMARKNGVQSKRATLSYHNRVEHGLAVTLGGGVEALDGGGDLALLNGGLEGKLGDKLMGQLTFARDLVSDTTASIRRQITRQSSGAGLSFDFVRLLGGSDYRRLDYSDGNHTNGYDLWASYLIFTEPTSLKLNYTYEFMDSANGPTPGPPGDDGFGPDDHPYWAPKNYWSNQIGLDFKHLLSDDTLGRGVPRYYTLAYTVGSDSHGYALQTAKGGFFVELTPNFMLDATLSLSSSQAHRNKEARLAVTYRW